MLLAADEVTRSLRGSWDLLQRRPQGLRAFDCSASGFFRSFASIFLAVPALVVFVASERARLGFDMEGGLFANHWEIFAEATLVFVVSWLTLPLIALIVARILGVSRRMVPLIVASNWTGVVAASMLSVPGLLFALGLATEDLAMFYSFAGLLLVLHMRWFMCKVALGVSGGVAGLIVAANVGLEFALRALII